MPELDVSVPLLDHYEKVISPPAVDGAAEP
jgi:hypothetical protein